VPKRSAGLLLYRSPGHEDAGARRAGDRGATEVLLVHPGGPYWARRDDGWWTIPKGEVDDGEDELAAAEREFEEELGLPPPPGRRAPLGEVVQAGGKRVRAWAVAGDFDVTAAVSGTFEMEWPPGSGRRRAFPEVDLASWYSLEEARVKILRAQLPLLDRLEVLQGRRNDDTPPRGTAR
jgi:predicted NUDIX family NTP pyrophosphohydrolase